MAIRFSTAARNAMAGLRVTYTAATITGDADVDFPMPTLLAQGSVADRFDDYVLRHAE